MADSAKIREAALTAMKEQGFDPEASEWDPADEHQQPGGQVYEPEAEESEADDAEDEGVLPLDGGADEASEDDEDEFESDGSEDDIPTEYFGVDLSDMPPAKRAALLEKWREQDKFVQSVLRRNAELERQESQEQRFAPDDSDDEPVELDEDAMLAALGVTEDDDMYEVKKEILTPVAKLVIQQQQQMQEMVLQQQAAAFLDNWESTLSHLEQEHGALPMSHDDLLDAALENGIMDPVDAYNRVMMNGRKVISTEAEKARQEAKRKAKKQASQPRPRNTDTKPEAKPNQKLSPKDAAKAAAEALGIDWDSALKSANRR